MAQNTKGVTVTVGSSTFTEVVSVSGPNYSKEVLDVTDLSDSKRTFIDSDQYEGGEVTIEAHAANGGAPTTGTSAVTCAVNYLTHTQSFNALVTGYSPSASGPGGLVSHSITLKVTG
jgi:hypothetical protein